MKLTVELSAREITTADALSYRLVMSLGDGYEGELPEIAFPQDVPGSVLTRYNEREEAEGKTRRLIREYEIEPEFEGVLKFPALEAYYHQKDQVKEEMIQVEPMEVMVKPASAAAGQLEMRPMRGLVTVAQMEQHRRRVWPWVVGGLAAFVLVVALVVYLIRRPKPAPPPRPAHEVAMERLRGLVARRLIENGQIEPFFVEITAIVREYIEQAFHVRAPEQTTEEFLAGIASQAGVARHRSMLEPFLTAADEVKFARVTPAPPIIQRAFDTARDFILQSSGTAGGTA